MTDNSNDKDEEGLTGEFAAVILDRILNLEEEAEAIAREFLDAGQTPEDLRAFLAQTGELDDPDSRELLRRVENLYAARNATPLPPLAP